MTVELVVARVAAALGRGHALFSPAPLDAGAGASGSSQTLTTLSNRVAAAPQTLDASGQFANAYGHMAQQFSGRLSRTAALDAKLSAVVSEAAAAEAAGRNQSGNVVTAAAETARAGPFTNTPAGQRALLITLRDWVNEQRQVISAYKTRDTELAAKVRQLNYPNAAVPYQPPPPPVHGGSRPCWIGTADGDVAALCPSNTDTVTYVDDAGNYVSKNLRTGEITVIFEPGPDSNGTGCWLPSADADRSICGPATTHWRYPHDGHLITEELQPDGEIKVIFQTPLGPLIP